MSWCRLNDKLAPSLSWTRRTECDTKETGRGDWVVDRRCWCDAVLREKMKDGDQRQDQLLTCFGCFCLWYLLHEMEKSWKMTSTELLCCEGVTLKLVTTSSALILSQNIYVNNYNKPTRLLVTFSCQECCQRDRKWIRNWRWVEE